MINLDDVTKGNLKEHNINWPQIPNHSCRILMIRCSGSGKTNVSFTLISQQPDIDEIYLYAKDPYEANYQLLITKRQGQKSVQKPVLKGSKGLI